jgi:hypothetical protein
MTREWLTVVVLQVYMMTIITIRFFLGQLYGVFILSIVMYYFCYDLFGFNPFTFLQLVDWFYLQEEGTKNAILGAIITVIGFMIAYASTSQNWKAQELVKLKLKAADEIENYATKCTDLIIKTNTYASWLMDSIDMVSRNPAETDVFLKLNKESSIKFLTNRQDLIEHSISVHTLRGRHTSILNLRMGASDEMNKFIESLMDITDNIWFSIPLETSSNPEYAAANIFSHINKDEVYKFIAAVEKHGETVAASAGMICGSLRSDIIIYNLSGLRFVNKERKKLEQFYKHRFKKN